jgi:hypothetical protein
VGDLDRPMSVAGGLDVVAEESEQAGHALDRIPIVVDDEDSGGVNRARREAHRELAQTSENG